MGGQWNVEAKSTGTKGAETIGLTEVVIEGRYMGTTKHSFEIAEHLWEALQTMAKEMAADPQVLVNQALFQLVRMNGYFVPGTLAGLVREIAPAVVSHEASEHLAPPVPDEAPVSQGEESVPSAADDVSRIAEIRVDLENLTLPAPVSEPGVGAEDYLPEPLSLSEQEDLDTPPAVQAHEEDELPQLDELALGSSQEEAVVPAQMTDPDAQTMTGVKVKRRLFVTVDTEAPFEVAGPRFVIGRDPSCNLILSSNKLSRQHAAIDLNDDGAHIEDLNSSNGTWFKRQRITRREIVHGDEYRLGEVRLRFRFRGE